MGACRSPPIDVAAGKDEDNQDKAEIVEPKRRKYARQKKSEIAEEKAAVSSVKASKKPKAGPSPGSTQDQIHEFIMSTDELYVRVLLFEPLDIGVLLVLLKEAGIKCGKKTLVTYLDEQGIAFLQNSEMAPKANRNAGKVARRRNKAKKGGK